jgi:hypothetical protein
VSVGNHTGISPVHSKYNPITGTNIIGKNGTGASGDCAEDIISKGGNEVMMLPRDFVWAMVILALLATVLVVLFMPKSCHEKIDEVTYTNNGVLPAPPGGRPLGTETSEFVISDPKKGEEYNVLVFPPNASIFALERYNERITMSHSKGKFVIAAGIMAGEFYVGFKHGWPGYSLWYRVTNIPEGAETLSVDLTYRIYISPE